MVRKKSIIIVFFVNLILIISFLVPIGVITVSLKDYAELEENLHFSFSPLNISMLKHLIIDSKLGNINIEYVYPQESHGIDIEINIDMAGEGLAKKTYSDIFNINFNYNQTAVNLNLDLQPNFDQYKILSQIRNLDITIKANTEAPIEIKTNLSVGDVNLYAPFGVKVHNIEVNVSKGNLSYEFFNCFIDGSINGVINMGNINLNAINIQYSQKAKINLSNSNGIVKVIVTQNRTMGANVTGIVSTQSGDIHVFYVDNSFDIGAKFFFYNHTTGWGGIDNIWSGFNDPVVSGDSGYVFTSFDFPTLNNYNLSFYKGIGIGKYTVDLSSA